MWIGAAVALVVFLGFPIGLQVARMTGPAPKVEMPKVLEPPLLNADNLPGTVWEVEPQKGIKVVVTMNAGGAAVAVATNPLVRQLVGTDTMTGSWSVSGPKLKVSTTYQGKNYATDLTISGTKLYAPNGIPVVRIR
jgi:hypothetical protein